jgi:thiol-disulfide isomerase/thioredoxin
MNIILKNKTWSLVILLLVLIVSLGIYNRLNRTPGELDELAKCIKDSGAKFYGTYWCPFCKSQKEQFASSARFLPYVECAKPGGQGTNPLCKNEDIKGYPTWIFADGSRLSSELSPVALAEKTGCNLVN